MNRAERLMSGADADSIVIMNGTEPFLDSTFWYLTGLESGTFEGTIAVVSENGLDVIVNRLEETTASRGAGNVHVYETRDQRDAMVKEALGRSKRVGVNSHAITYAASEYLKKFDVELTDVSKQIASTMAVKDGKEIESMRKACAITSKVAMEIPGMLTDGITEKETGALMDARMRELGGSGNAFDTIAAFGSNAAEPHYMPGDAALKDGDVALFDFGSKYGMYCADLTRTVFFGEPPDILRKAYGVVMKAKQAGMDIIRDGAAARDVDIAARSVIDASEFKGMFIHSFGHGVGMDVHEGTSISHLSDDVLRENMTVTAEPGIYIPGVGGIRVEDTLLVKKDGYERLTDFDQEMTVIR